jgi:hypothetical protein
MSDAIFESILRNPKLSEMNLTKSQLEDVLAAVGESIREVYHQKPVDCITYNFPGYTKCVLGGWLVVQENSWNPPTVQISSEFKSDVVTDQKVQALGYMACCKERDLIEGIEDNDGPPGMVSHLFPEMVAEAAQARKAKRAAKKAAKAAKAA